MSSFPFRTEDVLTLLGYTVSENRSSIYIQCPFCKSKGKPLNIELKSSFYRCCKNPDHKGNILTFYKELTGCENNKAAYKEILSRLGRENPLQVIKHETHTEQEFSIDYSKTDRIYKKILAKSFLSKKNRENLLKRGFLEEEIKKLSYKTLPVRNGLEIVQFVSDLGEPDLSGVPGFFVSKKGTWCMKHGKPGIMVPYHDFYGNICGIQIRKDDEVRETDPETGKKEHKYYYLSSRYSKYGTPAIQCIHYAGTFIDHQLQVKNQTLVLIEGAMKGDLFYAITGQPAICIPGVQCEKILKKELPLLKEKGIHTILNGLDMDRLININVLEASIKIEKIILEEGLQFKNLTWETSYRDRYNQEHKLPTEKCFIFTKDTLQEAIEDENLLDILARVKKCGRTRIFYAYKDKMTLTTANASEHFLFQHLKKQCNSFLEVKPIIWDLKLKGIDDYYANKIREIN